MLMVFFYLVVSLWQRSRIHFFNEQNRIFFCFSPHQRKWLASKNVHNHEKTSECRFLFIHTMFVRSFCLFVCLFVCLYVKKFVCLLVYLFVCFLVCFTNSLSSIVSSIVSFDRLYVILSFSFFSIYLFFLFLFSSVKF